MSMEEPHNSRYGKVMSGGQLPVTLDHSSILSLPQKSDTYVRPLATGQSQTVTVDEQQLGSFGGRLHTQSRPIKGKNPVVWYSLAELSEFRTQKNKTISEIY